MRLVLALMAAIGLAGSTGFPALAAGTLTGDLPPTMNCGESFPITAEAYSTTGSGGCDAAKAKANAQIQQFTDLLEQRCDGTLEITADTYTPVEGKCSGNAASGYDYGRQRTVMCVCSGNSNGMPANATSSVP